MRINSAPGKLIAMALAMLAGAGPSGFVASTRAETPVAWPYSRYWTEADRFVEVDGVRLRVREEGPRHAPPILLIHGFSFSLESWDGWAADLARDHRVIRFDLAGHGLSDPDPKKRYGVTDRVATTVALMDALGLRHATLVGNSFGGLVAWRLAAEQPARVDRLILVDSGAWSINGVTEKPVPVPDVMRAYLLDPQPAMVAASASLVFANVAALPPARLATMRDMIARPGNGQALIEHLERFTLPTPDAALASIATPTLIMWGSGDRLIPVAQANKLHQLVPGSRLVIYEGVGHAPHEEATARSLADLRAFLSDFPVPKNKRGD